jgi:uncharacterized membrane protein HdeD (DUF308 family)
MLDKARAMPISLCQAPLTHGGTMETRKNLKAGGIAFLSSGIAFFAAAMIAGQPAFIGVGTAMLVVGVVYLGKARQVR